MWEIISILLISRRIHYFFDFVFAQMWKGLIILQAILQTAPVDEFMNASKKDVVNSKENKCNLVAFM